MMQIVRKWQVVAKSADSSMSTVIFISDNYLPSVLRKLSDIEFGHSVGRLEIKEEITQNQTTSGIDQIK